MVVKVEQNKLVILSDASKDEVTVFAGQVVESKETSDTHSRVGYGNSNQHKFSAARGLPHPASSTKLLSKHDPPATLNRAQGRRHDSSIGCKVKIMCGPYRGYRGCVKGINGQNVRVELEAQMKVITVDRSHISDNVAVANTSNMRVQGTGVETPVHHPQTPMHSMGGQTPWRTPLRTPPHQSTPIHQGSAALGWGQWNPLSLTSPPRLVPTPSS